MIAYRSILPKRTAPVTAADFENLPRPIQTQSILNGAIQEGGPVIDFWNKHVPYHPQHINDLFMEDLDSGYRLGIRHDQNCLEFHAIHPKSQNDFSFRLMVKFQDGATVTQGSDINVSAHKQGQGIGTKIFKAFNECALALGQSFFPFTASLEGGAYTWAKLGAKLDFTRDSTFNALSTRNQVSDLVLNRFLSLQQVLSLAGEPLNSYSANAVKICSSLTNPFDLRQLARLPINIPVSGVIRAINQNGLLFEEALVDSLESAGRPIYDVTLNTFHCQGEKLKSVFRKAHDKGLNTVPIGRVLLGGLNYPAIIDFADQAQMDDIGKHSGGWRTIVPVRERVLA